MTEELERILASKRDHRVRLAALPIAEKLRMLDSLRERELTLRGRAARATPIAGLVREPDVPYRSTSE